MTEMIETVMRTTFTALATKSLWAKIAYSAPLDVIASNVGGSC